MMLTSRSFFGGLLVASFVATSTVACAALLPESDFSSISLNSGAGEVFGKLLELFFAVIWICLFAAGFGMTGAMIFLAGPLALVREKSCAIVMLAGALAGLAHASVGYLLGSADMLPPWANLMGGFLLAGNKYADYGFMLVTSGLAGLLAGLAFHTSVRWPIWRRTKRDI